VLVSLLAAGRAYGLDCFRDIDPVYSAVDVPSLIHARTPDDVERIRGELIEYVWKGPTLPQDVPDVETNVENPFPELSDLPNLSRIDRLPAPLVAFVSNMYLFQPTRNGRRLMIVHQGHGNGPVLWFGVGRLVRFFLAEGYQVLVVHMPLYRPNVGPFSPFFHLHDPMFDLETPTSSPFRYFLEPVVRAVNYAEDVLRTHRIYMVGVSGGGWTTTVAAAIDPRILISVDVAGSLPLYLRPRGGPCVKPGDAGDMEQYHPAFYAIADYLDLYVLGSAGRGRGHLQVLNQFDPWCFARV